MLSRKVAKHRKEKKEALCLSSLMKFQKIAGVWRTGVGQVFNLPYEEFKIDLY